MKVVNGRVSWLIMRLEICPLLALHSLQYKQTGIFCLLSNEKKKLRFLVVLIIKQTLAAKKRNK